MSANNAKRTSNNKTSGHAAATTTTTTSGNVPNFAERIRPLLTALVGNQINVTLTTGLRYTGVLVSSPPTGPLTITLQQAYSLSDPSASPLQKLVVTFKDFLELNVVDATLDLPEGPNGSGGNGLASSSRSGTPLVGGSGGSGKGGRDGFKTDTDISGVPGGFREKELKAWSAGGSGSAWGAPPPTSSSGQGQGAFDDLESSSAAALGQGKWDQFATNERLYGARTDYDEEMYTTKLDRSGKDYREREAKAARVEREILKGAALSNNAHMAEERGQAVDDSGLDEEDKYSGVIRGPDAYVPPGARKGALSRFSNSPTPASSSQTNGTTPSPSPAPATTSATTTPSTAATKPTATPQTSKGGSLEHNFAQFVSAEKIRLDQKRKEAVKAAERKDQDSRIASLVEFSKSFKLKNPVATDAAIGKPPSAAPSAATSPVTSPNRINRALAPAVAPPPPPTSSTTSTPSKLTAAGGTPSPNTKKLLLLPEIPPFNPARAAAAAAAAAAKSSSSPSPPPPGPATNQVPSAGEKATGSGAGLVPKAPTASTSKINPAAPAFVFKPNPNASAFTPTFTPGGAAAVRKPAEQPAEPANPFFGNKPIKKGSSSMHVKEDFTPFKTRNELPESQTIPPTWSFTGKPYLTIFPPAPPLSGHRGGDENVPSHLNGGGPADPNLGAIPLHHIPPPPPGAVGPLGGGGGLPPQAFQPQQQQPPQQQQQQQVYQPYQPQQQQGLPPNFRYQPGPQGPGPSPQPQHQQPPMHMGPPGGGGGGLQFQPYPPFGLNQPGPPNGHMFQPNPQMPPQQYMRFVPGPNGFQPGGGGGPPPPALPPPGPPPPPQQQGIPAEFGGGGGGGGRPMGGQ